MRWWISLAICSLAAAGPVEFGRAEYDAAVAARGLRWKAMTELNLEPPETFRIEPYKVGGAHITGGDLRGLMYGLLEAAEQIRATGHLSQVHEVPAIQTRGVRIFMRPSDLDKRTDEFWRSYFEMLARNRFNRFSLIFTDPTPYPFLVSVEGFPSVRVPGITGEQREHNLRKLRFISQTAADYAIDFTLGLWDDAGEAATPPEGLTRTGVAAYTRDGLRKVLIACPMIRTVQIQSDSERVGFYRDYVFKALRDSGRRVTLDPRGSLNGANLVKAAEEAGIQLRQGPGSWQSGFEIDPPNAPEFDRHLLFYWLFGRMSYDPKTKPPKGAEPDEYKAANQAVHLLLAAHSSDPNMFTWPAANPGGTPDDFKTLPPSTWGSVASITEAVRNRLGHVASAKETPLDTAEMLLTAASDLDKAPAEDFQVLVKLCQYHAHRQRAAYNLELFDQSKDFPSLDRAEQELKAAAAVIPGDLTDIRQGLERIAQRRKEQAGPSMEIPAIGKLLARPQMTHMPVKTATPNQPINLTLQIASLKDVTAVRLHYRNTNPAGFYQVVEKPAGASVTFTIPPNEVTPNWDILYYFEIVNRENRGWFEPDPPYYTVTVVSPPL